MANIFTIKHGSGVPNGKLQPYELGFDETGKKLYIGGILKNGALGDAIPISTSLKEFLAESNVSGKLVYYSDSKLYASNLLVVPSSNIGTAFPSSPKDGQVYFIIKE